MSFGNQMFGTIDYTTHVLTYTVTLTGKDSKGKPTFIISDVGLEKRDEKHSKH